MTAPAPGDKPAVHEVRVGCGPFMMLVLAIVAAHIICRAVIDPALLWLLGH